MKLVLIAAVARNSVIGDGNELLWRLPEDMQFFKRTTCGHPVIMGRKTWDSLPARFRPLADRVNIVVTRQPNWQAAGVVVVHTLESAIEQARQSSAKGGVDAIVYVIGGAQLYEQALPLAEVLMLTEIDRDFEGDTRFPVWSPDDFIETSRERHRALPPNDFDFAFASYRRRASAVAS